MTAEKERELPVPVSGPEQETESLPEPQVREAGEARLKALEKELERRDLEEIRGVDPEIRGPEDLLAMPEAEAFSAYVDLGLSLRDAYYLTHRQQLEKRAAEAGRRQALSALRGKEHLSALGSARSGGGAAVPPEELRWFRALNPEASDTEIQTFYNRSRKER